MIKIFLRFFNDFPARQQRCKDEMDGNVTWMRYKDIVLQDGKTTNKLTEHHGTRAELVDYIRENAAAWSFHRWVKNWMKWQSKLNMATFDGATEILILADYAAVYEMKGGDFGDGGLGRTRVGNGGVAGIAGVADIDVVASAVNVIVRQIEAGFWHDLAYCNGPKATEEQVVGPEVVREEQVVGPEVAKYVCHKKCNIIDVGSSATIALHPIDTSATTMTTTTTNNDKHNNDTHIETYVVVISPLFPTVDNDTTTTIGSDGKQLSNRPLDPTSATTTTNNNDEKPTRRLGALHNPTAKQQVCRGH